MLRLHHMHALAVVAIFAVAASRVAETAPVTGEARVVDATGLFIGEQRVQIHGIAGPLIGDVCVVDMTEWACGLEARAALAARLADEVVECERRDDLPGGLMEAYCEVGGEDVANWLVANGWALSRPAMSVAYTQEEQQARAAKLGVWRGGFVPPDDWRVREDRLGCSACAARKARLKKKQLTD